MPLGQAANFGSEVGGRGTAPGQGFTYDGCPHTYDGPTVCAPVACFSEYRFTGKERDAESGNDYFGARYYSSAMGRFMSPDWSAKEEPVPYARLDDPQTLNLYAYVNNNPLSMTDPDGHELTVAPELQASVDEMRAQSPDFDAELKAHEGPNNPNLNIHFGSTPNDIDGSPTTGNARVSLGGGPVIDNDVPVDRPYTYKGTDVTVNSSLAKDKDQVQQVLGHEVGHGHDGRTNTQQYKKDSDETRKNGGKVPGCTSNCHDLRPQEQRANDFKNKVNEQRKQWKKEHCHGFIHQTCS